MWILCPRYFADMPEDAVGIYEAQALSTSPFREPRIVYHKRVLGRRRAYKTARWLALTLDWQLPEADGELGVQWKVVGVIGHEEN